jgi:hypothetical protein
MTGRPLTIPAVHLSVLQIGAYKTGADAKAAQSNFRKLGVDAVVFKESMYNLFVRAAVHKGDLGQAQSMLQKQHVPTYVRTLQVAVRRTPTSANASPGQASQVSTWLSGAVSAANALTAVIADGAPARDAIQAYKTAHTLLPSTQVFAATGFAQPLDDIASDLDQAYQFYQRHNPNMAMHKLLQLYALLVEFPSSN